MRTQLSKNISICFATSLQFNSPLNFSPSRCLNFYHNDFHRSENLTKHRVVTYDALVISSRNLDKRATIITSPDSILVHYLRWKQFKNIFDHISNISGTSHDTPRCCLSARFVYHLAREGGPWKFTKRSIASNFHAIGSSTTRSHRELTRARVNISRELGNGYSG